MACAKSSLRGESKVAPVPTWCRGQAAAEDQYRTRSRQNARKESPRTPDIEALFISQRTGHELTECKAFNKMMVKKREQWVKEERLCFRFFTPNHIASECREKVKCGICSTTRHPELPQALKKRSRGAKKGSRPTVVQKLSV